MRIKKYKSITWKKKKKHDKIAFIDSYINHDKFVPVNNVLKEYNKMKEETKNPKTSMEYAI